MDVCILAQDGEILRHRHMHTSPETRLRNSAPDRADVVVAVEGLSPGTWLADLCAQAGRPFVLGPARSRKAMHGGQAKHTTSEAHQSAVLRRGGLRPPANVDPAARRATRHLRRRRMHLRRKRAERLTHSQHPHSQDHLPAMGQQLASKAKRAGGAERFADPAVYQSLAVHLAWIRHDASLLRDMA